MLQWLAEHNQVLSVLTNVGMLLVWIAYLQLFLQSYNRQRRAKILINRGAGSSLDARCLISNMSAEAIYVESIIAILENSKDSWSCPVTDVEHFKTEEIPADPKQRTRQGPLLSGGFMEIGSFRDLVDRVLRKAGQPHGADPGALDDLVAFEIQVIADYGSEDLLVGARRRFDLEKQDGQWLLRPHTLDTVQIRSRRERRQIRRRLEERL